jgi:hypothetical protein
MTKVREKAIYKLNSALPYPGPIISTRLRCSSMVFCMLGLESVQAHKKVSSCTLDVSVLPYVHEAAPVAAAVAPDAAAAAPAAAGVVLLLL